MNRLHEGTKSSRVKLSVALAIVVLLFAFVAYRFYVTRDVYAYVGSEVIYVDELSQATEDYEAYIDAAMPNASIDAREYALNQLILYKALHQEAKVLGRGYSQDDIDGLLGIAALHVVPEDFARTSIDMPREERVKIARDFFEEKFGWGAEQTDRYHAIRILQERLEGNVIKEYGFFRAWTNPLTEEDAETETDKQIQFMALQQQIIPRLSQGQSAEEIDQFLRDSQQITSLKAKHYIYSDFLPRISLGNLQQRMGKDVEVILGLVQQPGDYTEDPVVLSNGTYNVFRLEGVFGGDYATWDDYVESERKDARIFSSKLDVRRILGAL